MNCFNCDLSYDQESRIPKILTKCGHTICSLCLQSLAQRESVLCPECGVQTSGTKNLPVNTALLSYKIKRKPLGESNREAGSICPKHGKPIEAYCVLESALICVMCVVEDGHSAHGLMSIASAASKEREWIKTTIDLADSVEIGVSKVSQELENALLSLKKGYDKVQKDAIDFYRGILESVRNRQNQKLANAKEMYTREKDGLMTKLNQCKRQKELIIDLRTSMKPAVEIEDLDLLRGSKMQKNLISQGALKTQNAPVPYHFPTLQKETEIALLATSLKATLCKSLVSKPSDQGISLAQSHLMFSQGLRNHEIDKKRPIGHKRPVSSSRQRCTDLDEKDLKTTPVVSISVDSLSKSSISAPLSRDMESEMIYSIGGEGLYTIEKTDFQTGSSSLVASLSNSRSGFCAVTKEDGEVLILGGFQSTESELLRPELSLCKPGNVRLGKNRSGFGMIRIGVGLYIFGGEEENRLLDTMETWEEGGWRVLGTFGEAKSDFGYCSNRYETIYIAGGTGLNGTLKSVSSFDVKKKAGKALTDMGTARSALCLVYAAASLYAIAGFDGFRDLQSMEKLDLVTNIWTPLSPISSPRRYLTGVVLNEETKILCLGGFHESPLDFVEEYSIQQMSWKMKGRLATARYRHISLILNLTDP